MCDGSDGFGFGRVFLSSRLKVLGRCKFGWDSVQSLPCNEIWVCGFSKFKVAVLSSS